MPFIDSKVSVKVTKEQETELKSRLGQAISLIPGKSESWLMVGIEDEYHLYFRGEDGDPMAFIEVRIFGGPNRDAFEKMTAEITRIFGEVLGIAADHMYIKYSATTDWGWNGSNFQDGICSFLFPSPDIYGCCDFHSGNNPETICRSYRFRKRSRPLICSCT